MFGTFTKRTKEEMVDLTATKRNNECPLTIFIAVSRRQASPETREATRRAVAAVREASQHAASLDPDAIRRVELSESCLAPAEVAAARSRLIRRGLVGKVDAVVGLLGDASFDCGREVGWAIELDIPTLLLYPRGATTPLHVGGTPLEVCDVRDYGSLVELRDRVHDWLDRRRAAILAGPMRRNRQLATTEPLRSTTLAKWRDAVPEERRRASDAVQAGRGRLEAVLADGRDFAATRGGLTLDLARELGIDDAPARGHSLREWHSRTEVPVLPDDACKGLQDAIDTWDWDGSTTRRAIELGLRKLSHDHEVVMAGGRQRASSLGNRFAWKQLLDKDARSERLDKDAR